MNVGDLLEGKRLVICTGPGGVGKTTVSAAIALRVAAAGGSVALITMQPAEQLGNALGLRELGNEPVRAAPRRTTSDGTNVKGELWAMTLDAKRTLDDLIDEVAPDARRAVEIKSNPIYRDLLSTAASGSQALAAVAKLFDLDRTGRFDLLVLDTPPAHQALDFVNAPARASAFLDSRALQAVTRPADIGLWVLGRGASPVLGLMGRLSGAELLADAASFLHLLLGGMADEFSRRAAQIEAMLRSPSTAFLLVTSGERRPVDETIWMARTLLDRRLPLTGIVVNRVHRPLGAKPSRSADVGVLLSRRLSPGLASRVAASADAYESLVRRDEVSVSRLRRSLSPATIFTVPHQPRDIHEGSELGVTTSMWRAHGPARQNPG